MKMKTIRKIIESKKLRIIGVFYLLAGIYFIFIIPRFVRVLDEMYGNRVSIPALSQFLIRSNPYLWLICGCIPGVILILSDRILRNRNALDTSLIKACLIVLLMILIGITVVGLYMPFDVIIKTIN